MPFPKLTLVDQFNQKTEVKRKGTTTLILSFKKDVSSDVKKYLATKEDGFLKPMTSCISLTSVQCLHLSPVCLQYQK